MPSECIASMTMSFALVVELKKEKNAGSLSESKCGSTIPDGWHFFAYSVVE